MSELKRCPFCGGRAAVRRIIINKQPQYRVACGTCDIMTALDDTAGEVMESWNRRTTAVVNVTHHENKPLSLEELRGMDGEPVYLVVQDKPNEPLEMYALIEVDEESDEIWLTNSSNGKSAYSTIVGMYDVELYRRKPESKEEAE